MASRRIATNTVIYTILIIKKLMIILYCSIFLMKLLLLSKKIVRKTKYLKFKKFRLFIKDILHFSDGVFLVFLMGLLEDYFVLLYLKKRQLKPKIENFTDFLKFQTLFFTVFWRCFPDLPDGTAWRLLRSFVPVRRLARNLWG